jgi:hypothetical protein
LSKIRVKWAYDQLPRRDLVNFSQQPRKAILSLSKPPFAKDPLINKTSKLRFLVAIMTAYEAGRSVAAEVCVGLADVG